MTVGESQITHSSYLKYLDFGRYIRPISSALITILPLYVEVHIFKLEILVKLVICYLMMLILLLSIHLLLLL